MRKYFHQPTDYLIFIIGCLFIPISLGYMLWKYGWQEVNMTGILTTGSPFAYFLYFVCFFFLNFLLYKEVNHTKLWILDAMMLISLFMPYQEESSLTSNIHIILAYASFVYLQTLIFPLIATSSIYVTLYSIVLLFCFMDCLTNEKITGLSQVVYVSGFFFLLTFYYLRYKKTES